jgi:hypothetical protein
MDIMADLSCKGPSIGPSWPRLTLEGKLRKAIDRAIMAETYLMKASCGGPLIGPSWQRQTLGRYSKLRRAIDTDIMAETYPKKVS